jgi:hypothetical protein
MSVPYDGQSNDPNIPAISGKNTAAGLGVSGQSDSFVGVIGQSSSGVGVRGVSHSSSGVNGQSNSSYGVSAQSDSFVGVYGESNTGVGVRGVSNTSSGVSGQSNSSYGVSAQSNSFVGVYGESTSSYGVYGESQQSEGVRGISHSQHGGVVGFNDNAQGGQGVWGECQNGEGVRGVSHSQHGGVVGVNTAGGPAGFFEGKVTVTGDIELTGGDCAEEFDISGVTDVEPGTVMVLDQEGALRPSQQAYDKKVMGVISGAGDYKPGLILDKKEASEGRLPVALVGKVYCKVDAQHASIEVGDLLTTSPTLGHAMKAEDPLKAFGAVIGKALRPLQAGQGLIPILIALQ